MNGPLSGAVLEDERAMGLDCFPFVMRRRYQGMAYYP